MKALLIFVAFISIAFEIYGKQNSSDLTYSKDKENSIYELNDVKRLEDEPSQDLTNSPDNKLEVTSDYKGIVEIGYGIKITSYGYDFLKLNAIYDCKINPSFYFGLGTGLRLYLDNHAIFNTFAAYPEIPFFADFRMNFNNKKAVPYLAFDFGYTFQADDNFKGLGLLINPTIGVRFTSSVLSSINLGIGYDMQQGNFYGSKGPLKNVFAGAISLNAGIIF